MLKIKSYNNFDIYQEKKKVSLLHEYLSWSTNYVNKSSILNKKNYDDITDSIKINFEFKDKHYDLIINDQGYKFSEENSEISEISSQVNFSLNNIDYFLTFFLNKLELINDNYIPQFNTENDNQCNLTNDYFSICLNF